MSATTEPTMHGGNPTDASRLDQPLEAVPMQTITTLTNEHPAAAAEEPTTTNAANTVDVAPPIQTSQPSESEVTKPLDKGKERDDAAQPPSNERTDSGLAIGPAQDDINVITPSGPDPVCNITLLLTTGKRHPFRVDAKYLSRRNVVAPEETETGQPDPFSVSIYTLKELILRDWRSDWEAKPASPSSIRLIHFGKLLDDKEPLSKYHFSTESPNVVHMSVRPQDLDEEEPKAGSKNLSGGSGGGNSTRSGGCCVIL
ncbi:hypothetical protein S7711_00341 [Stachybotrys chartarum IBT 7711]|uniref:UBL3-like ubiquitin domain-containing protein n=1 Tax=Stachybotrys chartarum (strain CBS 109288 / IBT 7711) TaxID=1280523 RepID=A0A084B9F2_STACB|nr:hypothetical protein S7711_00341 [Stachybotrys chartarum IBT 7711]KFA55473.1 hypothetical protein S40293_02042 [Stachybotrys chartarum IBT 40293]KFA74196.1 hypothetical protein S40288_06285 [Stachybotrys chartarum IBT 40288]